MRTAGFEDPQVLSQRGRLGTMHNEIACMFGSVDLWLKGGDTRARRVTERFVVPVIANPAGVVPFFLLTLPASIVIRKLSRGSQMVAYARKPLAA